MMQEQKITLFTKLKNFEQATTHIKVTADITEDKIKKYARIKISNKYTKSKLGFMHAVLLSIGGQNFLISGPSGCGKSTLAEFLVNQSKAIIIANDWISVEYDGSNFYVSDLNFKDKIIQKERLLLSGLVFLKTKDKFYRDAFIPNDSEFVELINTSLDDMETKCRNKIASFWVHNKEKLPFYCAVVRNKRGVEYVAKSLLIAFSRNIPIDTPISVGVVGVGSVGVLLANELGKLQNVQNVHLYNRSKQKTVGQAIDLNQSIHRGLDNIYIAHDFAEDLFRRSSVVFLCFREKTVSETHKNLPERWQKVKAHSKILDNYAFIASKVGFTGTIFVITNPVDFLAYNFHKKTKMLKSELRTFQVYGVGLEADIARVVFYGRRLGINIKYSDVDIFGNHADKFYINLNMPENQLMELKQGVLEASSEVRSHDIRTVYAPVAAALRSFKSYLYGGSTYVSIIHRNAYIGRKVTFKYSLPMITPIDKNLQNKYKSIFSSNKSKIKIYS